MNSAPYGAAWIIEIEPSDSLEFDKLMDVAAYKEFASKSERVATRVIHIPDLNHVEVDWSES